MVSFNEVRQFMDADVIQHLARGKKQTCRDVDVSPARATAPVRFVVFEMDTGYGLPEIPSIQVFYPLLKTGEVLAGNAPAQQSGYGFGKLLSREVG